MTFFCKDNSAGGGSQESRERIRIPQSGKIEIILRDEFRHWDVACEEAILSGSGVNCRGLVLNRGMATEISEKINPKPDDAQRRDGDGANSALGIGNDVGRGQWTRDDLTKL